MGTAAKKTRDDASGPPSPASASAQPPLGGEGPPSGGHGGGGPPSGSSDGQPRPRPQSQPQAPPSFERKPNGSGTDFSGWKCGKRYKLLRALGHGSYGLVALATDLETNEKVAIKKIPNVFQQHIDARRILRETYILRHLDHLNLIKLRDIPRPENMETFTDLYLVFEYVLGALVVEARAGEGCGRKRGREDPRQAGCARPRHPLALARALIPRLPRPGLALVPGTAHRPARSLAAAPAPALARPHPLPRAPPPFPFPRPCPYCCPHPSPPAHTVLYVECVTACIRCTRCCACT